MSIHLSKMGVHKIQGNLNRMWVNWKKKHDLNEIRVNSEEYKGNEKNSMKL